MKMGRRLRIIGAKMTQNYNEETGELDKFWEKPEPTSYALHFKNAALKRKAQADPQAFSDKLESVLYRVPVYSGMDNRLFKYLYSRHKYLQKLASAKWRAGRAERLA
jgi:hypothetical protein